MKSRSKLRSLIHHDAQIPKAERSWRQRPIRLVVICSPLMSFVASPAAAEPRPSIALHGEAKLNPDFKHLPYANPNAPKGGRISLGVMGSFDSLNPLIVKGVPAAGLRDFQIESLMARGLDEPFTLHGLLAETIDVAADGSSVVFALRPQAAFSDRKPVTPEDVVYSFTLLKAKGRPNHRTYFAKVAKAETLGERQVRFTIADTSDRELPMILALMPVFARHGISEAAFDQTTTTPLIASGPYKIGRTDLGRTITYVRDPDYWARDLPITKGRFNFDEVRFEYYREGSVMLEAFKTGSLSFRLEEDPKTWAEGYNSPAFRDGRIVKAEVPIALPAGMTGLVFNTRRPQFADLRVRQALNLLFDFEWVNRTIYNGLYRRTDSFFVRSELSSAGKPADARERELLAPFASAVKPAILDGTFKQPQTEGSGQNRANQRAALGLLKDAGYELQSGKLIETKSGTPFAFEILALNSFQETLFLTFARALEPLGIAARVRVVDSAQYQGRLTNFDFDMIQYTWPASLSPGNEQLFRWSSKTAKTPGSFNYAGVESPAADAMIAAMLAAKTREDFTSAVRALDRVLLSGEYVIPLFHFPTQWIVYWSQLQAPDVTPLSGYALDTWWFAAKQ